MILDAMIYLWSVCLTGLGSSSNPDRGSITYLF